MLDLTTNFDPMLWIFAVSFPSMVVGGQPNVPPPHIAPSARPLALPPPLILLPGASYLMLSVHRVAACELSCTPRAGGRRPTSSSSSSVRAGWQLASPTATRPPRASSSPRFSPSSGWPRRGGRVLRGLGGHGRFGGANAAVRTCPRGPNSGVRGLESVLQTLFDYSRFTQLVGRRRLV